jgi:hypothetical protein
MPATVVWCGILEPGTGEGNVVRNTHSLAWKGRLSVKVALIVAMEVEEVCGPCNLEKVQQHVSHGCDVVCTYVGVGVWLGMHTEEHDRQGRGRGVMHVVHGRTSGVAWAGTLEHG